MSENVNALIAIWKKSILWKWIPGSIKLATLLDSSGRNEKALNLFAPPSKQDIEEREKDYAALRARRQDEADQERANWFKNLTVDYANNFLKQCHPHVVRPFSYEEFALFKCDPAVQVWFNFDVATGHEWVWKKYSLLDKIELWRLEAGTRMQELDYVI